MALLLIFLDNFTILRRTLIDCMCNMQLTLKISIPVMLGNLGSSQKVCCATVNITVDIYDQNGRASRISRIFKQAIRVEPRWLVHLREHAGATFYAAGSVRGCRETQWVHTLSRPGFVAYVA